MATVNGFGTIYYGWRHHSDGTSTATKWLSAFYIPVFPLGRYSLKVLTDFDNDPIQVKAIGGGAFGLVASQANHFQMLGQTSLSAKEVSITFGKAYVALPLLMILPFLIMLGVAKLLRPMPNSTLLDAIIMAWVGLSLFSALAWPIWAIRQSRGRHHEVRRDAH